MHSKVNIKFKEKTQPPSRMTFSGDLCRKNKQISFLENQLLQRCCQENLHKLLVMLNIQCSFLTVFAGAQMLKIKGLKGKIKKNHPRRRPLIGFLFAFRDSKGSDICFPTSDTARDGLQSIITDLHIHPYPYNGRSKKRLIFLRLALNVCASERTL